MKHAKALVFPMGLIMLACANQTAPTGGPKDETPPVLVRSSPDSNETNFRGKTIELTFDEILQLNNPKEEIIITPPVGKKTEFKLKDNRVTIEPEFDFRENTTYTINFREGIKDVTEGNIPEGLHLAFSTGPYVDSLVIEGLVKSALSEKVPEDITVAIYQADTFNIMEHSPEYLTKSSKTGSFRISNLKAGTYRIYAFRDKNKNNRLDSQSEQFGFSSNPIVLTPKIPKITIPLVNVDSRPFKATSVRSHSTINTIRLNKAASSYKIHAPLPILSTYGQNQSEIVAHYPITSSDIPEDSMQVHFTAIDSIEQTIDTTFYIRRDGREKIEEVFRTTLAEPIFNAQTNHLEFTVKFNKPLQAFNQDSLFILSDTATVVPLRVANIRVDTVHNELTYSHTLALADSLIRPELRLGTGFLISIDGDSSKAVNRNLTLLTQQSTAVLLVQVQTKQKNFIVEIVDASDKVIARAINDPKPVFRYLRPATLRVRVIADENGNGRWDTANYLQNKEPERAVYYLNSDKKSEIPLRANWEVGPNVIRL